VQVDEERGVPGAPLGFAVVTRQGPPGELVSVMPDPGGQRVACLVRPEARALVLGSAQPPEAADAAACAAASVTVVRRRSGGAAVLVAPRAQVWLDVFVPAGDPLADADVGRAAWWLGAVWAEALRAVLPPGTILATHRGGMVASRWSRAACFAGLGPGEVTLGGRKVVGLSQRRDRLGAWFHTMALQVLDAPGFAALLSLAPEERRSLAAELTAATAVLDVAPAVLEEALAEALA